MVARSIRRSFTSDQAAAVVEKLGVDLTSEGIEFEAFRQGMEVELEHGSRDPRTDVTDDDPILTGKIALAHLAKHEANPKIAYEDILWALINTKEFLFNH